MTTTSAETTTPWRCTECGLLGRHRLYEIGGQKYHAVEIAPATHLTPSEAEPCGPVRCAHCTNGIEYADDGSNGARLCPHCTALTPSDTSGFSPTELSTLARFEAAGDPWDDSDETGARL